METQKATTNLRNFEKEKKKELEESDSLISDHTIKPQESKQYLWLKNKMINEWNRIE